jgi:hypothetical protein
MRDSAGKAMLVVEDIPSVDAAIELLSQMTDQPLKSTNEIFSR